ncbi:MarR family winged helix-turn-helix transcriptional regulator [Streptomyces sp. H39-S7]|uniref:MarR family winged helix-turn-helix transcriptional regulator n=1 Tax=Streptomyces sp. H39-S7 TaxID=3004357 RepID=UPI0022B00F40|nr:MarR family transcriptional regulator [Streptomyces sp. H39-S7]MCZ4120467.1 MarR family transcriptional regulator [Streptomyces sp. H39-S7]
MDPRTTTATEPAAESAAEFAAAETTGRLADQLLQLTKRLHRAQRRHLEPLGITPAQSRLLRTVAHSEEPPRMADLAQRLDVVPRAVTTLVDALEAHDLVRRVPDPASRRVIRIELTEAGGATLHRLRLARRAAAEDLLAPLDSAQREALTALLAALDATAPPRQRC